jgi:hypothetical protein
MTYSNLKRYLPLFLMIGFVFFIPTFIHHANAGGGSPYIGTYSPSSNGLQVANDNSYLIIQLWNLGGRNPGLWGDSGGTAPVASSSLDIYDAEGATTTIQILSVTATSGAALVGGESEIKVLISVSEGVDYNSLFAIGPAATYEIYCANGGTKIATSRGAVFLHNPLAPQIVSAVAAPDNSYITVTFDKPVWGDAASSTPVVVGSVQGIASVSPDGSITGMGLPSITTSAGETTIEINLTYTGIPDSDDLVWLGFTTNSVYAEDGTIYLGYLVTGWVPLNDSVTITQSGGSTDVTEGGATDSYTVVLDSEPTNDVEITIATDTQIDASPMTLTFTDANWDTPQEVTVTAVDDSVVEGDHAGTISHIASSTDTGYDGISISDVTANITDNDYQPGLSEIPNINIPIFDGCVISIVRSTSTIYVGGNFTSVGGETRNYIAALNADDGTLTDWDPNADHAVNSLALSSDGSTVYAGGSFSTIGGEARSYIAALDTVTGSSTEWDPNANSAVYGSLILSPDGLTLYVGGGFTTIGGQSRNKIAALNTSIGTATSWNCGLSGPHGGGLNSGFLNSDGSVFYAGGYFTSIGGQARNYIAALNTGDTCTAVIDWNPGASNTVASLALTSDESTLYAGGSFSTIGGEARSYIAALNTITGSSTEWDPSSNGYVNNLTLSPNESTLYVGGGFTTIGGENRNYIAALDTVTGSSTEWDPNANNITQALVISSDGAALYAGGQFTTIGGESYPYFAEFDLNPGVTVTESGDSTDVTEGGVTDSYTVVLNTEPTDDVEITITPDTQVDVSPTTLTFTDADWNTPQEVTVTAVNDSVVEGDHTGTISHTDLSSDPNYNGIFIADVIVNITDNDSAASGGRRNPVITYYSYGAGHEPGTATSTATSTPPTSTSTPTTASLGALQQQIADLIAQLNALILQAKARGLSVPNAAQSLIQGVFTRDLDLGMTGEDVRQLQIYLNTHGFILAPSGPGSLGSETTRFGALTQAALIKFQQASNISPAAGYFGPLTRAYILSHP